ncbi:MAG: hypothetical protein AAGJ94_07810 [Pseudomonadota bacterium]
MLSIAEIIASLKGAAALFLGRPQGLDALDRSVEGFWRSFQVILLLLPINALAVFSITRTGAVNTTFSEMFFGQLPIIALDWVAFPAILALAAKPLGIAAHYVSYVVARNWAAPIASSIMTVPLLLEGAGWVPPVGGSLLFLVGLIVILRYHYMIVRISLGTPVGFSVGLVAADLLLTLLFSSLLS